MWMPPPLLLPAGSIISHPPPGADGLYGRWRLGQQWLDGLPSVSLASLANQATRGAVTGMCVCVGGKVLALLGCSGKEVKRPQMEPVILGSHLSLPSIGGKCSGP